MVILELPDVYSSLKLRTMPPQGPGSVESISRQEKYARTHTIRVWDSTIGSNGNLYRYDVRGRIGLNVSIGVSCPQLDFRKIISIALAGPKG